MNNVQSGMTGMEEEESEFKLGFILSAESTAKLIDISIMAEEDPYEIISRAIDTLYKAHKNGRL